MPFYIITYRQTFYATLKVSNTTNKSYSYKSNNSNDQDGRSFKNYYTRVQWSPSSHKLIKLRPIMGYYIDIEMNNTFALKDTQTYALLTVPAVFSFFYSLFNEDLSHIEKESICGR